MSKFVFEERPLPLPDADPFAVKESHVSTFFIFEQDEVLEVLKSKWSWRKYLKALFQFKFAKSNGMTFYFERELFVGRYYDAHEAKRLELETPAPQWSKTDPSAFVDAAKHLKNTDVKAYVSIPAKTKEYDLVLGELNDKGLIVQVHRCKRVREAPIKILRETKTITGLHRITALIIEEL